MGTKRTREQRTKAAIELGKRVRAKREAIIVDGRPLSQEVFARQVGVHRTYIGCVERGEINIALSNLCRIAQGLGVDPSELVVGLRYP